jgi:hypothetical protein
MGVETAGLKQNLILEMLMDTDFMDAHEFIGNPKGIPSFSPRLRGTNYLG